MQALHQETTKGKRDRMKRLKVSFELLLDGPNSNDYVADWITRSVEENLSSYESIWNIKVESVEQNVVAISGEQDCD